MNVITELKASSYTGKFNYNDLIGSFTCGKEKNINNISGSKENIGSFEAYSNGDSFEYNLHPVSLDMSAELTELVGGAVQSVASELSE